MRQFSNVFALAALGALVVGYAQGALPACSVHVVIPNDETAIPASEYKNCNLMTSLTFQENSILQSIGANAFKNTANLNSSINIPNSVKFINESAFQFSAITNLLFDPASQLESIGEEAFKNCDLPSLVLPSSLKTIDNNAFQDNYYLAKVKFHNGTSSINSLIPSDAFLISTCILLYNNTQWDLYFSSHTRCTFCDEVDGDGNYTIPSGLEETPADMFKGCTNLKKVIIPSTLRVLSESTFESCFFLTEVEFEPNSRLETIGTKAFYQCAELPSFVFSNTVKTIEESAFDTCTALASADFEPGSQLETIGARAFHMNDVMLSFRVPNSTVTIGDDAFFNNEFMTSIEIPNSVFTIGENIVDDCKVLNRAIIPGNGPMNTTSLTNLVTSLCDRDSNPTGEACIDGNGTRAGDVIAHSSNDCNLVSCAGSSLPTPTTAPTTAAPPSPPNETDETDDDDDEDDDGLGIGAIVGIAVGSLAALVIAVYLVRGRSGKKTTEIPSRQTSQSLIF